MASRGKTVSMTNVIPNEVRPKGSEGIVECYLGKKGEVVARSGMRSGRNPVQDMLN
jgi:hypothetical protein